MTDDEEVIFDGDDFEPVDSGGDYNDLKFVKPGESEDLEENEEGLEAGDYVQGTFEGTVELGGVPNFKVENDTEEVDYMLSKQMVLESQLDEVDEGTVVRVRFDGETENEDGTRSYYDWTVLVPSQ